MLQASSLKQLGFTLNLWLAACGLRLFERKRIPELIVLPFRQLEIEFEFHEEILQFILGINGPIIIPDHKNRNDVSFFPDGVGKGFFSTSSICSLKATMGSGKEIR